MENQHRKITGYRELTPEEVALMNKIKALGQEIEAVFLDVQEHLRVQKYNTMCDANLSVTDPVEHNRLIDATPERFSALAKTEFQTGLMYLTRAVAQPTTF